MKKGIKSIFLFVFLLCLADLSALPTQAQTKTSDQTTTQIHEIWTQWLVKNRIKKSVLLIAYDEKLLFEGRHNATRDTIFPIASNGKAITAACLRSLTRQRNLSFKTQLKDLLPNLVTVQSGKITLEQLLTHTSGIKTDTTQGISGLRMLYKGRPQHAKVAKDALAQNPTSDQNYSYNNVNYAILGTVIETLSGGTPYFTVCNEHVLKPLGIRTAGPHKTLGTLSSAGGWQMSSRDYLTFAERYFAEQLRGPNDVTPVSMRPRQKSYYGSGVIFDAVQPTFAHHTGGTCAPRGNSGSVFLQIGRNSILVNLSGCKINALQRLVDDIRAVMR